MSPLRQKARSVAVAMGPILLPCARYPFFDGHYQSETPIIISLRLSGTCKDTKTNYTSSPTPATMYVCVLIHSALVLECSRN